MTGSLRCGAEVKEVELPENRENREGKCFLQRSSKIYAYENILSWLTILHTENNFHKHPAAGENGKKRGPSWVTVRFSGISGLHPKCQEGLQVRESCVSWCQVSGTSVVSWVIHLQSWKSQDITIILWKGLSQIPVCVLVSASSWVGLWVLMKLEKVLRWLG